MYLASLDLHCKIAINSKIYKPDFNVKEIFTKVKKKMLRLVQHFDIIRGTCVISTIIKITHSFRRFKFRSS